MTILNTYEDVRARYNEIRPLVSKIHTREQDIRPIGYRRYKWERIAKLNGRCYALVGGSVYDGVRYYGAYSSGGLLAAPNLAHTAPIVWRPNSIRIHNGPSYGAGWFRFLENYLPWPFRLERRVGGRWGQYGIRVHGETFYLPRNAGTWRYTYCEDARERVPASKGLTFRYDTGTSRWSLASKPFEMPRVYYRVNKREKAKYAAVIKEFREWGAAVAPVFRDTQWSELWAARQLLYARFRENARTPALPREADLIRWALANWGDEDVRMPLLFCYLRDARSGERNINSWINSAAGFVERVEE